MANPNKLYSDIDLNFLPSPATGDISLRYNQQAVVASIKNLLFTNLAPLGTEIVGPKAVGQALFTHYLLLVEVAAMLLLAALVAAYHLGKREPGAEEEKE